MTLPDVDSVLSGGLVLWILTLLLLKDDKTLPDVRSIGGLG